MNTTYHPLDLKIGLVYYECEYGLNIIMEVTSNVTQKEVDFGGDIGIKVQYLWKAKGESGEEVDCLATEGMLHYSRLYKYPEYFSTPTNRIRGCYSSLGTLITPLNF